jgi:hypothetical protein
MKVTAVKKHGQLQKFRQMAAGAGDEKYLCCLIHKKILRCISTPQDYTLQDVT